MRRGRTWEGGSWADVGARTGLRRAFWWNGIKAASRAARKNLYSSWCLPSLQLLSNSIATLTPNGAARHLIARRRRRRHAQHTPFTRCSSLCLAYEADKVLWLSPTLLINLSTATR